jgi:hypothetical protein
MAGPEREATPFIIEREATRSYGPGSNPFVTLDVSQATGTDAGKGALMAKPTPRDKTLEDSFPASDPPANSGITGAGAPHRASRDRSIDERPTGTPNSDRHATETAHQWENEKQPRAKR